MAERTRDDARLYAHALGLWSVARAAPVGIARLPPIGPPLVAERRTGGTVAPTLPLGNHRVAFLHYHKTGHDLSPLLAKRASRFLDGVQFSGRVSENKRSAFSHPLNCHSAKDIQVWTAPDIALRTSPVPSCYFVVQFIRDPSDWAISYYDYHRQVPTPEVWVKRHQPNCSFAQQQYPEALGLDAETVHQLMTACTALVSPGKSYWWHLNTLPEAEGLRLMAYMNILGGQCDDDAAAGDLGRAAANVVALKSQDTMRHRMANVWMDEVLTDLDGAMRELAAFLVNAFDRRDDEGSDAHGPTLVQQLRAALVDAETTRFEAKAGGAHITSSNSTAAKDRKARLVASLQADLLLGPVHRRWRLLFDR